MNFNDYKNTLPYESKSKNEEVWKAYMVEECRTYEQFIKDAKDELGITDNPKADMLMGKAWERGHSAGYSEVFGVAEDLVDLIL